MKLYKICLLLLILPIFSIANEVPRFESLKFNEVNLRHYPEKDDPHLKTIKFKLTQQGMPVKVIREYNAGGKITEWRQVELFNGITGWVYHTQLSRQRTLLLKKDKDLYLFNSANQNSFKTKVKAKILSPKVVILDKIKNDMAKIQINNQGKTEVGWIILDNSIWGLKENEY